MANPIHPAPGVSGREARVMLRNNNSGTSATDNWLEVPSLQDITINNANDVFTWSQLDSTAKKQIATTSTNSVSMNIVVDKTTWFGTGTYGSVQTMANNGIFQASVNKDAIQFSIDLGDDTTQSLEGDGYITGLAPTTSADSPVWISPITITVTGEYRLGTDVS